MKRLLFSAAVIAVSTLQAQDCSELFFSEYVEGKLHNKALEIYNPTNAAIDLSDYVIKRYSNGSTDNNGRELILSGSIASKDVVVVTHGDTIPNEGAGDSYIEMELYNLGDIHGTGEYSNSPMYFNGNDAVTLEKLDGSIVDIFGVVGQDPDNGWNDDASTGYQAGTAFWNAWTKDHTMVRKASVLKGVTQNPSEFNTSVEYDSLSVNTFTGLGAHDCDCNNLSIAEDNAFTFLAYTNNAVISVKSAEVVKNVKVINISGQVVLDMDANDSNLIVEHNLPQGVYVLQLVSNQNTTVATKIVVQ